MYLQKYNTFYIIVVYKKQWRKDMDSIRLKARAKINLGLDVLGKRDDGYHEVRMIMQTVGIYDRIIIKKIPENEIRINSNLFFLPVNENNLIYKAARMMKDEYNIMSKIKICLKKPCLKRAFRTFIQTALDNDRILLSKVEANN